MKKSPGVPREKRSVFPSFVSRNIASGNEAEASRTSDSALRTFVCWRPDVGFDKIATEWLASRSWPCVSTLADAHLLGIAYFVARTHIC